jgi:hypothetical protein
MMPVTGWVVSTVFGGVVGIVFVICVVSLNKKVVRDRWGNIDFKKSDIYCMCDAVSLCIVLSFNSSFATPSGHLSILIRGRLMFRKLVLLAITLLIGIITLGGCSSSSPESSYAGILVINEKSIIGKVV